MRFLSVILAIGTLIAFPVQSEQALCPATEITVKAPTSEAISRVCAAVEKTTRQFDQCNLSLNIPLQIDVVTEIPWDCVGAYHCAEKRIEILSLSSLAKVRPDTDVFAFVPDRQFFDSVIVHELTHAALDQMPCPFDQCRIANEYIAYAMQVMSLSETQQETFRNQSAIETKISRDELSEMFLMLAPGRFAQKVWAHFEQRKDPCGYIKQIADGDVLLDRDSRI